MGFVVYCRRFSSLAYLSVVFLLLIFLAVNTAHARIVGTVLDSDGSPVPRGSVIATNEYGEFVSSIWITRTGHYALDGLVPGKYYLATGIYSGYVDEIYPNEVCGNYCYGKSSAGAALSRYHYFGEPVDVVDGQTTTANFVVDRGVTLSGTVTDKESGYPLQNIRIYMFDSAYEHFETVYTDADGKFRSSKGIPKGDYYFTTENEQGYIDQTSSGDECPGSCGYLGGGRVDGFISVRSQGEGEDIKIELRKGGKISGHVIDETTGNPVLGIGVTIKGNPGAWEYVRTDSQGYYESEIGLIEGHYTIHVSHPFDYVDGCYGRYSCDDAEIVEIDSELVKKDINVQLRAGGFISGRVLAGDTKEPVHRLSVYFRSVSGKWMGAASTDVDGYYTSRSKFDTGAYTICASAVTWGTGYKYSCLEDEVDSGKNSVVYVVLGHETVAKDLLLKKGGGISGTVVDEDSGLPLRGAGLTIISESGGHSGSAQTDSEGYFEFGGLPTGSYFIRAGLEAYEDECYGVDSCRLNGIFSPTSWEAISVKQGEMTTEINFSLKPKAYAQDVIVAGRVSDNSTGLPIINVDIWIHIDNWSTGYGHDTDTQGRFVVDKLYPGIYSFKTENSQGYVDQFVNGDECNGSCLFLDPTEEQTITLQPGSVVSNIEFSLQRGVKVIGKISDEESGVALDAEINIIDEAGNYVSNEFQYYNSDGYAITGALQTGTYYLFTSYWGWQGKPYINEYFHNTPVANTGGYINATPLIVTEGMAGEVIEIDFELEEGARITGTVQDFDDGTPIPASIEIFDSFGQWVGLLDAQTTAGTIVPIHGMPKGEYYLLVSPLGDSYESIIHGGNVFSDNMIACEKRRCVLDIESSGAVSMVISDNNDDQYITIQLKKSGSSEEKERIATVPSVNGNSAVSSGGGGSVGGMILLFILIALLQRRSFKLKVFHNQ